MKKVLVLCTGNSCRSQIAHGYLNQLAAGKAEIFSAGVETHGLNPGAIATMLEDGIDISGNTSNNVDEYTHIDFDYVITVCDNALERCPVFPGAVRQLHQNFPDPSKFKGASEEENKAEFRRVRNLIKEYLQNFVDNNL
ncbi:arsenate reductase ArsC [Emticicia sp. 21SJ11W-3]|uniref:arsenate reductase ArsC n=1 Tax=Emticicia sp. 21SJ11W-3 TaxID=2916755 RepID=UPI00209DC499|nr:arsenate reductase ArsC [Emticicia sp. 21SJ11W-3]UTA66436.1 arsenate reductase ArsC [Emticicia sp. 21SJ11W-3]